MAAQDELVLLERVFLRIGAAENDEQLQNALSKFLLPVLLKLSSPQEGVRKKVMELLVHVNKRLKSRPQVQLPVDALLLQYQDPAATSFLTNFTIIYIKMGYPRLNVEKKIELISSLLVSLDGKPQQHQDSILSMLMPVLPFIKIPADPAKCKTLYGLSERPQASKLFSNYALDFLLLPYAMTKPSASKSDSSGAASAAPPPPAGFSENAFKRMVGEQPLLPEQLEQAKLGLVKFISCGVYSEIDIVPHLIVASSDTRHSVASSADLELKRISGSIDWNNRQLLQKLFTIFLGTGVVKDQNPPIKPEHKRVPANTRIRLKIFPYLLKSREASVMFPFSIQVVFESLYGQNTNMKLKTMAVQFVHNICANCSEARLTSLGAVLLSGMLKVISESTEEPRLRSYAYVAIGKLGLRLPQIVTNDMSVLVSFFDALVKEDKDTRVSVQESLSLLAKAFTSVDSSTSQLIEALIMSKIDSDVTQVRQMALHYAITVFPSNHIPSRYIILLAAGDGLEDIRREAVKALHVSLIKDQLNSQSGMKNFPSFPELVCYLKVKAERRMESKYKYTNGNVTLPFNLLTYSEMLNYMRRCLLDSAGLSVESVESDQSNDQAPDIANYIGNLLQSQKGDLTSIHHYIDFHVNILSARADPPVVYNLLEMTAVAPNFVVKHNMQYLALIKNLMSSGNEDVREYAAQLIALLMAYGLQDFALIQEIAELIDTKRKYPETQHSAMIALGFLIGRKMHLLKISKKDPSSLCSESWFKDFIKLIVSNISPTHNLLCSAACLALGEVARNGPLLLPDDTDDLISSKGVVTALCEVIKNNKLPIKCRERAATASGYLCVGDSKFPYCKVIIDGLLQFIHEISDPDISFVIGDALCCAILGPHSPSSRDMWTLKEDSFCTPVISEINKEGMEWLVNEILEKYILHSKPFVRQASCIWLLALLKKCGNYEIFKKKLKKIQNVLLNLLSDRNDITQDVASKGLSLLYELGTEEEKKELVTLLVDTVDEGRKQNITVTEDSTVFEEGMLGKNPLGGSLTTYKEICSLATDLNQPDLIYKFMHLSNHHSIWNSKKGAAFGFGNIVQKSGEQLAEHLPTIVPKLFRYQYDPSSEVRNSFTSIWHAIVTDSQKTVDKYLKEIIEDIIANLTSPQWRVRESCCLALSDLLRGRNAADLIDYLPVLWEICFRVRDDIKETVRNSADSALKSLNKVSVRFCDINCGKTGEHALSVVLPTLIRTGLGSSVSEVRAISLSTVVQISKNSGILLKPHLPLLIVALLEALSEHEPQLLSYLSVKLESNQESQEKLDSKRIAATKSSPMMESINYCAQYIDSQVLQELIPRLTELIHSSVGLGTKAGCSHLIVLMCHECPQDLQIYSGKLLASLMGSLNDRNSAVRKSYATAIGNVVKISKDSSIDKLISKIQRWYLEKEDESARASCVHIIQAIAQHSPEVIRNHAAKILPLAFFSMHNRSTENAITSNAKAWEEVWIEFTPGMESGVKLYIIEITSLIQAGLDAQLWTLKMQAASATSTVASKLNNSLEAPQLGILLNSILTGLSGRTWTGKESLLKALASICVSSSSSMLQSSDPEQPSIDKVIQVLSRECKKGNLTYKEEAIKALAAVLEKHKLDRFYEFYSILQPTLLKDPNDNSSRDDNDDDEPMNLESALHFREISYEALGQAWPEFYETQEKYLPEISDLFAKGFKNGTWKVQLSILKSTNKLIFRLQLIEDVNNQKSSISDEVLIALCGKIIDMVCDAVEIKRYNALRIEALSVTDNLLKKLQDAKKGHILSAVRTDKLKEALISLSDSLQSKDKALEVVKSLSEF